MLIFGYLFSALERKMSMRAHRDELIQKGILLPDQPASTTAQQLPSISGEL